MEQTEQLKASSLMLDMGVAIPVRPFKYLYRKRNPRKVVMHTPGLGGLTRIGNLFLSLGVTMKELKDYSYEQNLRFVTEHSVTISRIVAYAILRGPVSGKLLNRIVAWWLRWRVHPMFLMEAMYQLMVMLDMEPFLYTISSAERINPMKPNLSHSHNGS